MNIKTVLENGTLTVYVVGEIDHHSAGGWREAIDREIVCAQPTALVLDFSDVSFMDSSGVGLVMGRYKCMHAREGTLRLRGLSPRLEKMMTLAGLDRLPVWETKGV